MLKSIQKFHPRRLVSLIRRILKFPKAHDLAFVAIFRDEAKYLDEWIRFHNAQGVTHFFLYNDESIDNFKEVLAPWLSDGAVTLLEAKGRTQEAVYDAGIKIAKNRFNWLGFCDIDEFVFSPTGSKLPEVLNQFSDFAGVFVFWKMFGSANLQLQKEKGVLESFTSCLKSPDTPEEARQQRKQFIKIKRSSAHNLTGNPLQGKSLVNLRKVKKMGVHFPRRYRGQMVDEKLRSIPRQQELSKLYTTQRAPSMDLLRVNHYWSRGLKALEEKVNRPGVTTKSRLNPEQRASISIALSWEQSLNTSRDWAILKLWRPISSPKVFIIGFNKTATRALSKFFEANGMPSVHWHGNKLAQTMVNNLKTGEKIMHGYDSHYKVYSDMIIMTDSERVEANAYFREMDLDYPGSFFILNNRDTSSWILSRERHKGKSNFLERSLTQMKTTDINLVRETWRLEKEAHEKEVRQYFQGRRNFLELDIESDQIPKRLADFLDMDFDASKWEIVGKTKIASNEE